MPGDAHNLHVYLVDRDLPGSTLAQLEAMQQVAIASSRQFTAAGRPVRYLRSTFILGEARCLCLFEAVDAAVVEEVNQAAQIPFTRVVEALDLSA
jgi:hypothetical protein